MQMSAVRYEDFMASSHGGRGYGSPTHTDEELELALARARGAAHDAGFEAGKASAEATFDETLTNQLASIEQALIRAQECIQETEAAAQAAAVRLTRSFVEAIAPRLAASSLAPEICAALEDALKDESDAKFCIEVATDRFEEIEEAIASFASCGAVKANAEFGPSEARVHWEGGFDQIDAEATIAKAMKILDARLTRSLSDEQTLPDPANEVEE